MAQAGRSRAAPKGHDLSAMAHILIVDDEAAIADTLIYALRDEGFTCTWLALAGQAIAFVREQAPDLVILDVGLPDMTGFEACKQIRRDSDVPILFLTARSQEIDRIVGLEIGGDDYVTKPFSPREVAARVKVILRRLKAPAVVAPASPLSIDRERLSAHVLGRRLNLTPAEFRLLDRLAASPGRVYTRAQLLDALGAGDAYDRSIDTHIKTLRAKLREVAPSLDLIQTHRGSGYSLNPEAGDGS